MAEARINILLPTYEPRADFLSAALDSLFAQTEQNWTLFIHDDASQTDVHRILEPYLSDARITFEKGNERLGIGGNWNVCLQGRGETPFIQFLFQDDWWEPRYLSSLLNILDGHPNVGFVSTDHVYHCEEDIPTSKGYEKLRAFKHENLIPGVHEGKTFLRWWMERGLAPNVIGEPPFVMLRRSIIEQAGPFREDMPQFLDVEYWARLLTITDWYYHPESLGTFRVHSDSASVRNYEEGGGIFDRFRCLEMLTKTLPPEERGFAKKVLLDQFEDMVEKFFNRKAIKLRGTGRLKWFCLRHPLLVCRSVVRCALRKRSRK